MAVELALYIEAAAKASASTAAQTSSMVVVKA